MNDEKSSAGKHELQIVRIFDAPRELVFREWTEAENMKAWFAPDGYTCTACEIDARTGGRWRVAYRSDAGDAHQESGEFRELNEPERLVLTLTQRDDKGHVGAETLVTVTFASLGSKTEMTFMQTGFVSAKQRDGNAEGWNECFRKQADNTSEHQIRALFGAWCGGSSSKDIDQAMGPIAEGVHSYEHEAPLQYRGLTAVREICQRGFEAAEGAFSWDIPDLQVVVRGDLAVSWGLNRMRFQEPGKPQQETWSRGTRVLQKMKGEWKVVHQHVSYPYDPGTGKALTSLKP